MWHAEMVVMLGVFDSKKLSRVYIYRTYQQTIILRSGATYKKYGRYYREQVMGHGLGRERQEKETEATTEAHA